MSSRLEARLRSARERALVGRDAELAQFGAALAAIEPPFVVAHVCGPAGIGKSVLLDACARMARDRGLRTVALDGSRLRPEPHAFAGAVAAELGAPDPEPPGDAAARLRACTGGERLVLLIDEADAVRELDAWLRDEGIPALPDGSLVLLAHRDGPARGWRDDPGWQLLSTTWRLRNLAERDERALLALHGVPEAQHDRVVAFTHGHPLATALVADLFKMEPGVSFEPREQPTAIRSLVTLFTNHVPGPAHRTALEACALVHAMTEPLLQAMLGTDDVRELWGWLCDLSFAQSVPGGIALHPLAQEVLAIELRWRHPDWHAELHRRARRYYTGQLKEAAFFGSRSILTEYAHLFRRHPLAGPMLDRVSDQWSGRGAYVVDRMRTGDEARIVEIAQAQEGDVSARAVRGWLERPDARVVVVREGDEVAGFNLSLLLDAEALAAAPDDPAIAAARRHVAGTAPLRPGELLLLIRAWMAADTYQAPSPVQSLLFVEHVRQYLQTPGLAVSILACADESLWGMVLQFVHFEPSAAASYEQGGRRFAAYAHDWRAEAPSAWLDGLAEQGLSSMPARGQETPAAPAALGHDRFEKAVREALKMLHRPERLCESPLLHARLVARRVDAGASLQERAEALAALVADAVGVMESEPRDAKYAAALRAGVLEPSATLEAAAEALDLPFSTFRRHLARGRERLTELLWQEDLGRVDVSPAQR